MRSNKATFEFFAVWFFSLCLLAAHSRADSITSDRWASRTLCDLFFYARSDIPGAPRESKLKVFTSVPEVLSNAVRSVVVFNYFDRMFVGSLPDSSTSSESDRIIYCTQELSDSGKCPKERINHFLFQDPSDMMVPGRRTGPQTAIQEQTIAVSEPTLNSSDVISFEFTISRKGMYCVTINDGDMRVKLEFPQGELDSLYYPYLPFYGAISIFYLVVALLWFVRSAMYWKDILPVQNHIAGLLLILMIDYAMHYGLYDYWNKNGQSSSVLVGFLTLFNSLRNAASIFVVLIVSMGYGVVKPTLGTEMRKCVLLALALFVSFVLMNFGYEVRQHQANSSASSSLTSSSLIFLFMLPSSFFMTVAFFWIMTSIEATLIHLQARRQMYKLSMYRWLKIVLIITIGLSFISVLVFGIALHRFIDDVDNRADFWPSYWFFKSGWMNILYLFTFMSMALLWRPTKNNARYGLEELPESENYDMDLQAAFDAFGTTDSRRRQAAGYPQSPVDETTGVLYDRVSSDGEQKSKSPTRPVPGAVSNVYAIGDELTSGTDSEDGDDFQERASGSRAPPSNSTGNDNIQRLKQQAASKLR